MVQKIYSKMHPVSCTNTHHDVTYLLNRGMAKNTKTWISWERNLFFLQNKKILKLCVREDILRSYRFVAEVTFKSFYFTPKEKCLYKKKEKAVFIRNEDHLNTLNTRIYNLSSGPHITRFSAVVAKKRKNFE